jgi:hypothetical protein
LLTSPDKSFAPEFAGRGFSQFFIASLLGMSLKLIFVFAPVLADMSVLRQSPAIIDARNK